MSQHSEKSPREFTGRHMLMVTVAFFGVIIAVNMVLAFYATGTWSGLVVPNSYVASQRYNAVLDAAHEQARWGWTSAAEYRDGTLSFDLKDAGGYRLHGFAVKATVSRPTHEGEDRKLVLEGRHDGGLYRADIVLAPGVWEFDVEATAPDGRVYGRSFRLWVPVHG